MFLCIVLMHVGTNALYWASSFEKDANMCVGGHSCKREAQRTRYTVVHRRLCSNTDFLIHTFHSEFLLNQVIMFNYIIYNYNQARLRVISVSELNPMFKKEINGMKKLYLPFTGPASISYSSWWKVSLLKRDAHLLARISWGWSTGRECSSRIHSERLAARACQRASSPNYSRHCDRKSGAEPTGSPTAVNEQKFTPSASLFKFYVFFSMHIFGNKCSKTFLGFSFLRQRAPRKRGQWSLANDMFWVISDGGGDIAGANQLSAWPRASVTPPPHTPPCAVYDGDSMTMHKRHEALFPRAPSRQKTSKQSSQMIDRIVTMGIQPYRILCILRCRRVSNIHLTLLFWALTRKIGS